LVGLAHVATIGASGAVAAKLVAYSLLYPRARVSVSLWLFFVQEMRVPIVIMLRL
jgi:membrane associated rhomboid family serine protease